MSGHASLNHVYRTVWNQALGAMVAVAEIASSGGRSACASRSRTVRPAVDTAQPPLRAISLSILVALIASPSYAQTLPTGGVAVHGGAAFNTSQPNRLTVTTTNGAGSNHSAINWNSFSIGSGNTTNFVQPSAASLSINRVVTNTPSQLFGTLSSNGKLVLVNQSGIAVGAGAVVDTAGFTASALAMSEADAIAGRLRFGGGSSAGLTVDGSIIARGGDVVLIAPNVDVAKTAVVESQGGSVVLAAGQSVEVTGRGLEGITLQLQAPTDQAVNLGTLKGDAVGIFAGTLRHSGMIQAVQANLEGGKVVLRAVGDAYVEGQGQINAAGAVGKGGSVDVLGKRVAVMGDALIDVSGPSGGGSARVGGDFQGGNPNVPNADISYFGPKAVIKADASDAGDGGRVIVWADDTTRAYGKISARGGPQGGNGGFVEVSGHKYLDFQGFVDTVAPRGKAGTLLLDPNDITINNGTNSGGSLVGNVFSSSVGAVSNLTWATINGVLASSDLQVQTTPTTIGGAANIDVLASTALTGNHELRLVAQGDVRFGANVAVTAVNDVKLIAGWDGNTLTPNVLTGVGPGDISFGANSVLSTPGNLLFNARGSVTQVAGSSIAANVLTIGNTNAGSLPGGINMPGNNNVNTLAVQMTSAISPGLVFNNAGNLILGPGVGINGIVAGPNTNPVNITSNGALTVASPVTSGGNVTLRGNTGITVANNLTVGGALTLDSSVGAGYIQQTGGVVTATAGLTTINAKNASFAGDIEFFSSGNDFLDISLSGASLSVVDINALNVVTPFVHGSGSNVYLEAGAALTFAPLVGSINTTLQVSLFSGTSLVTPGAINGSIVILGGPTGVAITAPVTATTLNIAATGTGAGVTQGTGAAISVSGATSVNAPTQNVTLTEPGNNFNVFGAAANTINLLDSNSVTLDNVTASQFNLVAGANVNQVPGTAISGAIDVSSVGGTIALTNTTNAISDFAGSTGGAVTVVNGATAMTLGTVNAAAFTLQSAGPISSRAAGSSITTSTGGVDIQTTGGGIDFNTGNASNIFSATSVKLEGTGSIDLSGAAIDVSTVSSGDLVIASSTGLLIAPGVDLTFNNGGRWLTYLLSTPGHVYGPNFDPITNANFRQFNAPIGATPLGTGNGNLFAIAPTILGTLTGSVTKVFDGSALISLAGTGLTGVVGTLFGETVTPPGALGLTGTLTNGPNVQGPSSQVSVTGTSLAGVSVPGSPATPTYGYQYSFGGNIGNVTPAVVTVSPISLSGLRAYDGTAIVNANIFTLSGLQGSDSLSLSGFGLLVDKNVGTNKPVSLNTLTLGNGPTGGLASNYTFSGGTFLATITPAPLGGNLNVTASNKVYDGLTAAGLTATTSGLTGLIQGDVVTLASLSGDFSDRHVGTGKAITVNSVSLGGADGANYTFAGKTNAVAADITQRPLSTWTGAGGNTLWSNDKNWDALPDRANVLAVVIPAGAGQVTFDAGVDPTSLQSLTSGQTLAMTGGSLAVNSDVNLAGLVQTGGVFKGISNLNVSDSFRQTGGSLQLGRDVSINQASGNLVVGDISARRVNLKAPAGGIGQNAGMLADVLVAEAATGLAFTSVTNKISAAELTNTGTGNIVLTNSIPMLVSGVRNADGDLAVNNTGGLFTLGLINVPKGKVSITANSPLRITGDGIVAGGDVNLTATNLTSPGDITIDAPIVSGGAVTMNAANSLTQNDVIFGADGVAATASGFSYGPRAVSGRAPVAYSVGGVAVRPPPSGAQARAEGRLAPDAVIAFIQRLERVQRQQLDDVVSTATGDGLPGRRRDRDAVATEGNICRR